MHSPNAAARSPRHVLVVANPTAGSQHRRQAIDQLLERLASRGLVAQLITDLDVLPELANRLLAQGDLRAVVAGGGDGTVAELVNRLEPAVPITVFPLGTANLLAGYLGLTRDASAMADMLADGATGRIDAGRANGRVFVLMAGCGFDADVVERLHRLRSGGHISYWTWARPIWDAVCNYEYPDLKITCFTDEGAAEQSLSARWAFVVNLPSYAGQLQMAPDARPGDGQLDLATFGRGSLLHGLRYLGFIWLAMHRALPDYHTTRVRRLRIESDRPVPYQLDGDPGGQLPLDVEVLPARITLVAPRARLQALGLEIIQPEGAGAT